MWHPAVWRIRYAGLQSESIYTVFSVFCCDQDCLVERVESLECSCDQATAVACLRLLFGTSCIVCRLFTLFKPVLHHGRGLGMHLCFAALCAGIRQLNQWRMVGHLEVCMTQSGINLLHTPALCSYIRLHVWDWTSTSEFAWHVCTCWAAASTGLPIRHPRVVSMP